MSNSKTFQDWAPVVLTKSNKSKAKKTMIIGKQSSEAQRLRKVEKEEDSFKIAKGTINGGKLVAKFRIAKGMTKQKDLANRLGVKADVIARIESGKAPVKGGMKSRLNRIFGKEFIDACKKTGTSKK